MAKKTVNVNGMNIVACEEIEALKDTANLVREYQKLKALEAELKTRTDAIKAEVMAKMMENDVEVMKAYGYKVAIVTKKGQVGFDKDALKADHPEIFEEYVKPPKNEFTYQFNVTALNGKPAKEKGTTALVNAIKEALAVTVEGADIVVG